MYTDKDIETLEQAGLQAVTFSALSKTALKEMCEHLKSSINTNKLLKASEVAKLLSVSKMTVGRYIRAGKIPTITFLGNVRIKQSEVNKLLSGE